MSAFRDMIQDDNRSILYQDYTANMLGVLTQAFAKAHGADNWQAPSFLEMVYPDELKDQRTAQDIKNDILSRLK